MSFGLFAPKIGVFFKPEQNFSEKSYQQGEEDLSRL